MKKFEIIEHSWSDTGIYSAGKRVALLSIADEATEDTQEALEVEMRANANLMAAAPELLEALKACAQKMYESCLENSDECKYANDVIAYAEGAA